MKIIFGFAMTVCVGLHAQASADTLVCSGAAGVSAWESGTNPQSANLGGGPASLVLTKDAAGNVNAEIRQSFSPYLATQLPVIFGGFRYKVSSFRTRLLNSEGAFVSYDFRGADIVAFGLNGHIPPADPIEVYNPYTNFVVIFPRDEADFVAINSGRISLADLTPLISPPAGGPVSFHLSFNNCDLVTFLDGTRLEPLP